MKKILILFAHPKFEKSRVNKVLIDKVKHIENVTFHDLYEEYPNFHIDVKREQELLLKHDVIIWHHPFYWYSSPAILKQWKDMVLEFNWAHGPTGLALQGKTALNVITTGGKREIYCATGSNSFTVNEFLRPYEQTANLCGMRFLPPFAVMGTYSLNDEALLLYANQYKSLLDFLKGNIDDVNLSNYFFINDLPILSKHLI
ncbi:NAD(P)H-dependent oxidoreductase [Neotamlana laminarinivorans]|uniref:NAD(P)H-dependent oxidoreductase n=1 Tax=Neotamlana laminarinivorans TaxID=2883124 RepID=A0A9X1HX23_9FLAO|nr:NAD(P)H-dependent oxidoreductase [Tamlana laminarinivorans]MCB4797719.1 NAD(P)H-dependent oxidoreductase [Tamlana laminarinivorans]